MITSLATYQIFVAGTNEAGQHYGGAAAQAHRDFGLVWGVGEGLSGQTYALPTMEGKKSFQKAVDTFIAFAIDHPELEFLLTPVGTGIAGYSESEVQAMFDQATQSGWPTNVMKWSMS